MADVLETALAKLPADVQVQVRAQWQRLPPDVRADMRFSFTCVERLVRNDIAGAVTLSMEMVQKLMGPAMEALTRVAIVGAVNVGKSSLYNAIVPDSLQRAAVHPVPGTTREVQSAHLGMLDIMDTPGADHWADISAEELQRALDAARSADFLLIVFDASRGVLPTDMELHKRLCALGKKSLVVLNKIDLIKPRERASVIASAASALGLEIEQVVPVSAARGEGVADLVVEIAVAEPRLLGFWGTLVPAMRRRLAWTAIRRSVVTSVAVALTPLPVVDIIPLTGIQVALVLSLARIHDRKMTLGRAVEVMATFGVAFLARTLFQELVRLGGLPGWVLSASIAGTTTLVLGVAASRWFETGEKPKQADLRKLGRMVQERIGARLRAFGRRGKARKALTTELREGATQLLDGLESDVEAALAAGGSPAGSGPGRLTAGLQGAGEVAVVPGSGAGTQSSAVGTPAALTAGGYGAIFDVDGVLVDSGEAHFESWVRLGQEEGHPFSRELFTSTFGMHNHQIIPRWWGPEVAMAEIDRLALRKEELYREIARKTMQSLPGAADLVRELHAGGFSLAVASSGPPANVRLALELLGIDDLFAVLVTGDDVTQGKPHPEVFQKAIAGLGLIPERCVVLEDAPQGVEAGLAAGAFVLAVTTSRPAEDLQHATRVVASLEQVGAPGLRALIDGGVVR